MFHPALQQISNARIGRAVDTVFHRADFRSMTYRERAGQWLLQHLIAFIQWLMGGYHTLRGVPFLFWTVMSVLVVLLLAVVGRTIWISYRRRLDLAEGAGWSQDALARRYGDPWAAAQELSARGDYTSAAHALYAAMLDRAARNREVHLHPSKTVGDYVRELRSRSSSSFGRFRDFARTYEVVIYGVGTCDAARYERLLALAVPMVTPGV